jgi:hypothetical protein
MRAASVVAGKAARGKRRKLHDAIEAAAQVGNAKEPRLRVGHGLRWRPRKDFAGMAERKEVPALARFDREPRRGHARRACSLQTACKPGLEGA